MREIGITAKVGTTPGTAQATANIELRLDPAAVELKQRNSGWVGKIDEILIEQSESGEILAKISDTREFEVPASGRVEYDTKGVAWPLAIPIVSGGAKIRIVVRDTNSGRIGSLALPLSGLTPITETSK